MSRVFATLLASVIAGALIFTGFPGAGATVFVVSLLIIW